MALVGWYRCNDNAADMVVADASGNGYTGTAIRNTNLFSAVGEVGNALNFNGTSDYVDCNSRFMPTGAFTLTCWAKPTSLALWQTITQKGNTAGDIVLRIPQAASGVLRLLRWTGVASGLQYWTSTLAVTAGTWNFVAAVYSGVANVTFYTGTLSETITPSASAGFQTASNFTLATDNLGANFYPGGLDDVRLYDEALTAQQIGTIYNSSMGSSRPYPWQPRIVRPTIQPLIARVA